MIDSNDVTGPAEPARFGLPGSPYVPWDIPAGLSDVQVVARPARRRVSVLLVVMIGLVLGAGVLARMWSLPAREGWAIAAVQAERWSLGGSIGQGMAQAHRGVAAERGGAMSDGEHLLGDLGSALAVTIGAVQTDEVAPVGEPIEPSPLKTKPKAIPKPKLEMHEWRIKMEKRLNSECSHLLTESRIFAVLHTIEAGRVTLVQIVGETSSSGALCIKSMLNGQVERNWLTSTDPHPSGPREYKYLIAAGWKQVDHE